VDQITKEKREKIVAKIRALREKTTEGGCTEAEAMAAAEIVSKLMAEYDLTFTDVEVRESEVIQESVMSDRSSNSHPTKFCMNALETFCGIKIWFGKQYTPGKGRKIYHTFFGLPKDVEIATYLYNVILGAMEREAFSFKESPEYNISWYGKGEKKIATNSFLRGMAVRISQRLRDLHKEQMQTMNDTPIGRELVVVKKSVVADALRKAGICLKTSQSSAVSHNQAAYAAGQAAGDRVGLHRGVSSGGNGPLALR
jgi:hypothetical protein